LPDNSLILKIFSLLAQKITLLPLQGIWDTAGNNDPEKPVGKGVIINA
jgi:hypothetical protein